MPVEIITPPNTNPTPSDLDIIGGQGSGQPAPATVHEVQPQNIPATPLQTAEQAQLASLQAQLSSLQDQHDANFEAGCVTRNEGSGWYVINDAGHESKNVASVTSDNESVTVTFTETVDKIIWGDAEVDETYGELGYFARSSVGTNSIKAYIFRNFGIQGYLVYNGTDWSGSAGVEGFDVSNISVNGSGEITITHDSVTSFADVDADCRSHNYDFHQHGSTGPNSTTFKLIDRATGADVTTLPNDLKLFFSRDGVVKINPAEMTNPSGNFWFRFWGKK